MRRNDEAWRGEFRKAFAALRLSHEWPGYEKAAKRLGCSTKYLRWAAGEYGADSWPGSESLAKRMKRAYPSFHMNTMTKRVIWIRRDQRVAILNPGDKIRKRQEPKMISGRTLIDQPINALAKAIRERRKVKT